MADDISAVYEARRPILQQLKHNLEEETKAALAKLKHIDRISFRVKGTQSFLEKVEDRRTTPPYQHPLVEVEDQVAGRVIVFFIQDVHIVVEKLKGTFNAVERKYRRPARDAEFGYESYHLICNIPPQLKPEGWDRRDDLPGTFELQVRTLFMHAYAEPQHDIGYKAASELPSDVRRELAWIAASAWGADHAYERVRNWNADAAGQ